jgi:hypothetical protein
MKKENNYLIKKCIKPVVFRKDGQIVVAFPKNIQFDFDRNASPPHLRTEFILTWVVVLEELTKAAIAWAGKKALDWLAEKYFPNDPLNQGIQNIQLLFVSSMQEELRQHQVTELERKYRGALSTLDEYKRGGGVHRLNHCDTLLNELLGGFEQIGYDACNSYASVGDLKICVLQAYTKDDIRDESSNIAAVKNRLNNEGNRIKDDLLDATNSQYGEIIKELENNTPLPQNRVFIWYTKNGVAISAWTGPFGYYSEHTDEIDNQVEQIRQDDIDSEFQKQGEGLINALNEWPRVPNSPS